MASKTSSVATPPVSRGEGTDKSSGHIESDIAAVVLALNAWSGVRQASSPRNRRSVRTRLQLLEAAKRVFIRKGYVECSVEDILTEADISRGTFYAHFRSKKAVFAAVIEDSVRARLRGTDVSDLALERVSDRIAASVRNFLHDYAGASGLSSVIEQAASYDQEFRKVRLIIRDSFARRIARGIRRQQAKGIADPEVNATIAALTIVSMMTNFAQVEIGWREQPPNEEMVEMLTRFWCVGIGLREEWGDREAS